MLNYIFKKTSISQNTQHAKSSGFTLIETLLAVAVLTISIVGALSLIVQSTSLSGSVRNEHIAANLAQEGVELVQNIRTTNWVVDQKWNKGILEDAQGNLPIAGTTPQTYIVDPATSPVTLTSAACGSAATNLFQKNIPALGMSMYVHDSNGTATNFSRCITITSVANSDANYIRVQSTVSWGSSSLTAEDHLYNWK